MNKQIVALASSLSLSLALAAGASAHTIVTNPWIRATVPQQTASGAYLQVRSPDNARLVAVTSSLAASVQLHKMEMNGGRMTMREVDAVDLPAGATVNFASGGYHVMLSGLKRPLKAGDVVPLSLLIERNKGRRETITVNAPVKPLAYAEPDHH